jgi:hypothetical protein
MIYDNYEKNPKELTLTDEYKVAYDSTKVCYICEQVHMTREMYENEDHYEMLEDYFYYIFFF